MRPAPPLWLALAALAALLGMGLALAPSGALWPEACPASIRTLRARAWRALSAPLRLLPGGGGRALLLAPPSDHGLDAASGLPLWSAADLALHGGCAADFAPRQGRTLLGVAGNVLDVTEQGLRFYGPGAGYCQFAGRDATRSLALGSLAQADLARGGDVAGVEARLVREQHDFYVGKYEVVGKLLPTPTQEPTQEPSAEGAGGGAAA